MEENRFGIKSIKNSLSVPIGTTIRDYFKRITTYDWVFGTFLEKVILILCILWSFYSIIRFVWELF